MGTQDKKKTMTMTLPRLCGFGTRTEQIRGYTDMFYVINNIHSQLTILQDFNS